MKHIMVILAILLLAGSSLACCVMPEIPDIDINVPTIEVGEMQNQREEIPPVDAGSVEVEVVFAAGEMEVDVGDSEQLFSGHFRYNVERWEPTVAYNDGVLTIEQGGIEQDWAIPTGNTHNEWELEFSPNTPLEMNLKFGAGEGKLNFTGLQLTKLDMEMGAGDFDVRFDEPNEVEMSDFSLDTGAARLDVSGIGHASPGRVSMNGGVGDIALDFTGQWNNSSDVNITAGIGAITLRLPDDVGVWVDVDGGLTDVETDGLREQDDAYVNDAFGEAEIELRIHLTAGIGSLRLIQVSND